MCKLDDIESVTEIMGDIHDCWMKQLDSDRMRYYYLNEYSIHQIIYLCEKLANEQGTKYPDQVYVLLSRVKKKSTFAEIRELLSEATKVSDSDDENTDDADIGEAVEELQKMDLMKRMARKLVNEDGIEQNIAKAAVQAKGYNDKDECIDWILLNYDSQQEIEKLCEQFDEAIGFSHEETKIHANTSVVHDRSHRTLQEIMTILQREAVVDGEQPISSSVLTVYSKYSNSTASLTLQDCLSIRHLGKFLTMLGRRKDQTSKANKDPDRRLPPPLKKRRPNLIICPEQEMLPSMLSLYMHKSEEPLPQSSEVLLCTEDTTTNEVERFLRRAMGKCESNGNPLFCLVFAHKLTHNVAEAAEKMFDCLTKDEHNPNYQLAVFTSSQQHYLTAIFDQYLTEMKIMETDDNKISDYLRRHLSVNMKVAKRSAACVESRSSSVKVVYSKRSGVGKSLHIKRLKEHLEVMKMKQDENFHITTVRFMQEILDVDHFIDMMHQEGRSVLNADTHLVHVDLTPAVSKGVNAFTFNLLILGSVEDTNGRVWRKNPNHLYVIEVTDIQGQKQSILAQSILPLLPKVRCLSPAEEGGVLSCEDEVVGMDDTELESETFQRPLQYLLRHDRQEELDDFYFDSSSIKHDKQLCIETFLKYLSIPDPSWLQVYYFAAFLNLQLKNCEKCIFCDTNVAPELKGLKAFSIQFMILMAQDFTTPSLHISDESDADSSERYIEGYKRRRKWEEISHPYIFFNDDGVSMTFINVNINDDGNLINAKNEIILENVVAGNELVLNLQNQGVPIGISFDQLTRKEKLKQICKFMGIQITDCNIGKELWEIVQNITATGVASWIDEDGTDQTLQVVPSEDVKILSKIKAFSSPILGANFEQKERVLQQIAHEFDCEDAFSGSSVPDPDPSYELTTDNVLKIFAIYMRFRSGIPVIIMGETGCGKTRTIEFISKLKEGDSKNLRRNVSEHEKVATEMQSNSEPKKLDKTDESSNMITLKVHGGVTVRDIQDSIIKAKELASNCSIGQDTILFYDEANTTEAIYAIKEAVCDQEINGQAFAGSTLKIVAACNPYKRLSKEAVDKLESSGLGYRMRKSKHEEKFGSIPMRQLVYRVVPLPPSMQPFVWDFGQLGRETEKIYIEQMTKKLCNELGLCAENQQTICNVLSDVQSYMRDQGDECRYVSLRDVERCMIAYEWFHSKSSWLYEEMNNIHKAYKNYTCCKIRPNLRTLIQVLSLCYHASLENRKGFRCMLSKSLQEHSSSQLKESDIHKEILACQEVIVADMKREKYVALNEALMENVYMMALCIDMRIPLFLIGKPGSSKSMAKTLISENMQGDNAQGVIFKKLKQVQVVSFQCSALTQASGIIGVFKQCMKLQSGRKESFAAAVVLDEIGLAEDSPNMPLKVLHPLLESGSTTYEPLEQSFAGRRVAFVGISNWSLDPAKMNRGIFVTRNKPDKIDMEKTTEAIFSDKKKVLHNNKSIIEALTETYLSIAANQENEYFGLRDFYSLMKMIKTSKLTHSRLKLKAVMDAVVRNFSGGRVSYIDDFYQAMTSIWEFRRDSYDTLSVSRAIDQNLTSDSRYLLLLANQYAAINLLNVLTRKDNMLVIFGSSFPGDRNNTEICRNINRIKVCMETGNSVIILNLADIYESLYDALNQHYVMFGDQKYVDLALGGHRVKCRVHDDFRMIILENKDVVYEEYPTPLINRLEKHCFDSQSLLDHSQKEAAEKLLKWTEEYCTYRNDHICFDQSECFIGFHDDTISSVVLISDDSGHHDQDHYRNMMVQTATMDSIFRLSRSECLDDRREIQNYYLNGQQHDTLDAFLLQVLNNSTQWVYLYEIVSFSNVLSEQDRSDMESLLHLDNNSIMLLSLHQFSTEQQYQRKLNGFFRQCLKKASTYILLIQCSQAERHHHLISCARFGLTNLLGQYRNAVEEDGKSGSKVIAAFLLSTCRKQRERNSGSQLLLQHTNDAEIVYVDELRPSTKLRKPPSFFFELSMKKVFENCLNGENLLDVEVLFKECVCMAVAKLKSNNDERNLLRVATLTKLFDEAQFTNAILGIICRMHSVGKEETDGEEREDSSWCVDEACNVKSLIEGGTFRKTIWMCIKRYAAKFLAHILSIIDSNDNLDVLEDSFQTARSDWEKDLCINLLQCLPFSRERAENEKQFQVDNSSAVSYHTFKTPFSYHLHRLFTSKLHAAINTPGLENAKAVFLKSVENLSRLIDSACSQQGNAFATTFLSDLVHHVYSPRTMQKQREVEIVANAVDTFSKRVMEEHANEDPYVSVYYILHGISQYLTLLADMFCICPELMENTEVWLTKQEEVEHFCIHELAFNDLIDILKRQSLSINSADVCINWHETVSAAVDLYNSISESVEAEVRSAIQKQWIPISFLYVLLNKLIPSKEHKDYIVLIAKQASLLSKGCRERSLKSPTFARLLCNTLSMCLGELELKLTLRWKDTMCKSCARKIASPIQLSCGHVICKKCFTISQAADDSTCPTCSERILQNDGGVPLVLDKDGEKELRLFKQKCTSLLLTFLKQFLHEDYSLMEQCMEVDLLLLQNCVIKPSEGTELGTLAFDLNINARSLILECLLQNSNGEFKRLLDDEIRKIGHLDDKSLAFVIIVYLEMTIYTRNQTFWDEEGFMEHFTNIENRPHSDFTMLQEIALLRVRLQHLASQLYQNDAVTKEQALNVGKCLNRDASETFKRYLVKCGCLRYGTEWLDKARKQFGNNLFPACLARPDEELDIDHWSLLGEVYRLKVSRLATMTNENLLEKLRDIAPRISGVEGLDELCEVLSLVALIFKRQDLLNHVLSFLKEQTAISLWSTFEVVRSFKKISPYKTTCNVAKVMFAAICAIENKSDLMSDFAKFLHNPSNIKSLFLPSMPESTFFKVPEVFRKLKKNVLNEYWTDMYTCPNGHIYTIGDCTHPVLEYVCYECGAVIGGADYKPAAGNQRFVVDEKSQAGYLLEEDESQKQNIDDPCDRMTKQGVAVTRFMIHTCMLIALQQDKALCHSFSLSQDQTAESFAEMLWTRLQENLQDLSQSLAVNMDDSLVIMNEIFLRIALKGNSPSMMTVEQDSITSSDEATEASDEDEAEKRESDEAAKFSSDDEDEGTDSEDENQMVMSPNDEHQPCGWSGIDARRRWEERFRAECLVPVFAEISDHLDEAWEAINECQNLHEMALYRIIHDLPLQHQHDQKIDSWTNPVFWKALQHPSLSQLVQAIRDDSGDHEILQLVLNTANLQVIKFLKVVLEVQKKFIARYQHKKDLAEVDRITFSEFLADEQNHKETKEQLERYFEAWNSSGFSVRIDGCHREINQNSPVSLALPSNRGSGRWAKQLTETLIEMQNSFLQKCSEKAPGTRFHEVATSELQAHHLISIDREQDLLPLIKMHTSYNVMDDDTRGMQHRIVYNLSALEKEVKERFILRKKLIDKKSVECIQYPQDIGIGTDWEKLCQKIPQVPLTEKMKMNIDVAVRNQTQADLCEAVRQVTIAISFLSKVNPPQDRGLKYFLKQNLLLADSSMIHKSVELCHTLDLYQRLTWHRAVMFTRQGVDPYRDVFAKGQQEDMKIELDKVSEVFPETNVKLLQQRINEILQKRPDYNLNWSLSRDLFPFIEDFLDKNVDNSSWYKKLPVEVCYKHITHLFKLSVLYLDNRD